MDGGTWKAAVHGVAEGQTRLSDFTFTFTHWRRKWQPTPVFLPGESQGQGSLVGCRLWGRTELDTIEATQQQQQLMICRFYFIGMQLLYNVVLVSIAQQSELDILIYIYIYIYIFPHLWISFTFRSPQSIEYSTLCYTVGSYQYLFYT